MSELVRRALFEFTKQYVEQYKAQHQSLPSIEHDSEWVSRCEVGVPDAENSIYWQPIENNEIQTFENIASALDIELHPDIASYWTAQLSGGLPATFKGNWLELLQVWNDADLARLQENIIAHIMMKKRLNQQITVFIAVTDDDQYLISLLNETGEVVLEPVGKEPVEILAPSLTAFLGLLEPSV